jgi:hypothetical protein
MAFTNWRGIDPITFAGLAIAVAALAWLGASLRTPGLPAVFRLKATLAGAAAIAVWFPIPFICVTLFLFGIHGLVLLPLFVAPIPLLLWGAGCASGSLVKTAVAATGRAAVKEPRPV